LSIANIDRGKLLADVLTRFEKGFNCAESIFVPFAEALGYDKDFMRVATPFGAGIGGRRDICGIITGGTMVIGLVCGRSDAKDADSKMRTYKAAARYYRWFKEQQKIHCSEIVTGRFAGHTQDCVELLDEAQAQLFEIIGSEDHEFA
jgi:C_GCAxxG_C_C family probable redox protein